MGMAPAEGPLVLDPRTHLAVALVAGVAGVVLVGFVETLVLELVCACYLALTERRGPALRCLVTFAVVAALSFLPLPGLYGVLLVSLLHMMPACTVMSAFVGESPSAIMCALGRWHVPPRVLIGICMLFRFVSVLGFEARSIARGIRMRGIFPHAYDVLLHPALAYECVYTPLVMRCLRLSSELAASSELRGIEAGCARTTVHHVGLGLPDALALLLVAGACALIALVARVRPW